MEEFLQLLNGVPVNEKSIAFSSKYYSLLRYLYYVLNVNVNNAMASDNLKENVVEEGTNKAYSLQILLY